MANPENAVLDRGVTSGGQGVRGIIAKTGLMPGFTLTIFLSALLLFSVQPMFAKMTLPLLGGVPNVWNTAMVFFQATLLGGYLYAHLLARHAPLKIQIAIHATVLAAGFLFLPLAVANGWTPPDEGAPAFWLMALYAVSIGVPFFALSATAPLLQRWFSYTDHSNAQDPYFLYAASNLGSLLSLLAYPVVIEPMLGVGSQSVVWSFGYYALAIAILCSGVLAMLNKATATIDAPSMSITTAPTMNAAAMNVTWTKRLIWIGLAFVPSSLMLGVTTHFSVNVASAPFIWVAPLALYLLTFVFVFATKPLISEETTATLLPAAVVAGVIISYLHDTQFFILLISNLIVFFIIALRFHGRLAAMRPEASKLTEFYIFMSVGGVLGGIFNALIAPVIFSNVFEYGIVLAISGIAAAGRWPNRREALGDLAFAIATFVVMSLFIFVTKRFGDGVSVIVNIMYLSVFVVIYLQKARPLRFVGALLAMELMMMVVAPRVMQDGHNRILFTDRSFFGVTRVDEIERDGHVVHQFVHGNTVHNVQFRDPEMSREMISYFSPPGPWGQIMEIAREQFNGPVNASVIGLGAGALACYAQPGDQWTFYEIDPAIAKMAKNPELFTYLSDCAPEAPIILGDARLKIENEKAHSLDLLLVDAFSSDAIPSHLVTREALALYQSKLKEGGLMFFHTSNRFADVSSVVISIAEDAGLTALEFLFVPEKDQPYYDFVMPAVGVAVGPPEVMATAFAGRPEWAVREPHPAVGVWTDDYSHVIGALIAGGQMQEVLQDAGDGETAPATK